MARRPLGIRPLHHPPLKHPTPKRLQSSNRHRLQHLNRAPRLSKQQSRPKRCQLRSLLLRHSQRLHLRRLPSPRRLPKLRQQRLPW